MPNQNKSITLPILGVPISSLGLDEAVAACAETVRERQGGYACFVNVHLLSEASRKGQSWFRELLSKARFCFADGMPLVWVARVRGVRVGTRPCGPDFMDAFLREYSDFQHAFVGGAPGQGALLAEKYGVRATSYSPPVRPFTAESARQDWDQVLSLGTRPQIVWVGLGAPKQEQWMAEVSRLAPEVLFLGVGAAFDFLTGAKPRAPRWLQRRGLEWAYRLASEPGRLAPRYLDSNSRFLWKLFQEELKRFSARS